MNKTLTLIALLCLALIGFVGCGNDDSGNNTPTGGNGNGNGNGNGDSPFIFIDDGSTPQICAGCTLCSGASCSVQCDRSFGEGCHVCTAKTCDSFMDDVYSCMGNDCDIKCVDAACSSVKCNGKDCPVISCKTSGCELCSGSSCTAGCYEGECNICNSNAPTNFLGCDENRGTIYRCSGNDCSIKCENAGCSAVKCDGNDCPATSCQSAGCILCSGSSCIVGCDNNHDYFCEICPSKNFWTCGSGGTKYGCSGEDCVFKCKSAGCIDIICEGDDC